MLRVHSLHLRPYFQLIAHLSVEFMDQWLEVRPLRLGRKLALGELAFMWFLKVLELLHESALFLLELEVLVSQLEPQLVGVAVVSQEKLPFLGHMG